MESINDLQITCQKCRIAFKLGDHVLMTKNTHFFHLLCYKSKGKFYRYFNRAATFVTWTDSRLLTEYVAAVDELIKFKRNLENQKLPKKFDQLKNLQLTKTRKAKIVMVDEDVMLRNKTQAEKDENVKNEARGSSSSTKLAENLSQLMSDVDELKTQICFFSEEKLHDESTIEYLEQQNQTLKEQNQSLREENSELRWLLRNKSMEPSTLDFLPNKK